MLATSLEFLILTTKLMTPFRIIDIRKILHCIKDFRLQTNSFKQINKLCLC